MKFLLSLSLVVSVFLSSGCQRYAAIENPATFSTPFGYIAKGDSMRKVISRLGDPEDVSHYQRREVWQYNFTPLEKEYFVSGQYSLTEFAEAEEVFVYFENGNVVDMKFSHNSQSCDSCN